MLENYRNEIDEIDEQLINLLNARFAVTKNVGEYKRKNNLPILNNSREEQIINKIKSCNLEHQDLIIDVYMEIMNISKGQQDV